MKNDRAPLEKKTKKKKTVQSYHRVWQNLPGSSRSGWTVLVKKAANPPIREICVTTKSHEM